MNPNFLQKPRNNFSVAGTCRVNDKGKTESSTQAVAVVKVKTKEKDHAPIISNAKV